MWFAKPDSSYQQSTSPTLRRKTTQDAAKQSHALHDSARTSAGSTELSASRWRITCSTNDENSDAEGHVAGKAVSYQCNMRGVNLSQLRRDTQCNWFMNAFDHDAADVCTAQARAPANSVSQIDFARTTRYFSRDETGCHFTRHDCRTKLYILYLTAVLLRRILQHQLLNDGENQPKVAWLQRCPCVVYFWRGNGMFSLKLISFPVKKYFWHFAKFPNGFPQPTGDQGNGATAGTSVNHPCA